LQLRLLLFLDCFLSPSISQLGTLNNSLLLVWTGSALPSSDPTWGVSPYEIVLTRRWLFLLAFLAFLNSNTKPS